MVCDRRLNLLGARFQVLMRGGNNGGPEPVPPKFISIYKGSAEVSAVPRPVAVALDTTAGPAPSTPKRGEVIDVDNDITPKAEARQHLAGDLQGLTFLSDVKIEPTEPDANKSVAAGKKPTKTQVLADVKRPRRDE